MYNLTEEKRKLEEKQRQEEKEAQKRAHEFAMRTYLLREGLRKEEKEETYWESDYCGHDLYLENQGGSEGKEAVFVGQRKEMFDGL